MGSYLKYLKLERKKNPIEILCDIAYIEARYNIALSDQNRAAAVSQRRRQAYKTSMATTGNNILNVHNWPSAAQKSVDNMCRECRIGGGKANHHTGDDK